MEPFTTHSLAFSRITFLNYLIRLYLVFFAGLALIESASFLSTVEGFCLLLAKLIFVVFHVFDTSITLNVAVLRHGFAGFALEVAASCSALPQTWLFISALLAFPATWPIRLVRILLGFGVVQLLNVIRLSLVFYLGRFLAPETLHNFHEEIFPWLFSVSLLTSFFGLLSMMQNPLQTAVQVFIDRAGGGRRMLCRLLGFGVPIFLICWKLHLAVLMPTLIGVENKVLGALYKKEQVQLSFTAPDIVILETGLLIPKNPNLSNQKLEGWALKISMDYNAVSACLAIAWTVLCVIPYRRLRNCALAILCLLPLMILNLHFTLLEQWVTFLLGLETRIVQLPYSSGLVYLAPPWSWTPVAANGLTLLLAYTKTFIVPAILLYVIARKAPWFVASSVGVESVDESEALTLN